MVFSRIATCRYQNEDFIGAASKLKELIDASWWSNFWNAKPCKQLPVPKRHQFYLRRAEYYWYASLSIMGEGDRSRYFRSAIEDFEVCIGTSEGENDVKVLAWVVVVTFVLTLRGYDKSTYEFMNKSSFYEGKISLLVTQEPKKNWLKKPYVVVALAIAAGKSGDLDGAKSRLAEATRLLHDDGAHPKAAREKWLEVCGEIAQGIKGGLGGNSSDSSGRALKRKLVAVAFMDVFHYSSRAEKDEEDAVILVRQIRELLANSLKLVDARQVKDMGDGWFYSFVSVDEAIKTSLAIQEQIARQFPCDGDGPSSRLRIGVHIGDVIEETNGDLFGDVVNVAARIQGIAEPGSVWISEEAKRAIRHKRWEFASQGERSLKRLKERYTIYSIVNKKNKKV